MAALADKGMEKQKSECLFISDVLKAHITGKKTPLKTKLAVTLHGTVRSNELSDLASDLRIAGTYKDSKYLNDAWALDDLSQNQVCPPELAEGLPGTAVLDNDDWQTEDITGETQSVNRTNMMFVQPEKWISETAEGGEPMRVQRKDVKEKLDKITETEHSIKPYSTKERGKP